MGFPAALPLPWSPLQAAISLALLLVLLARLKGRAMGSEPARGREPLEPGEAKGGPTHSPQAPRESPGDPPAPKAKGGVDLFGPGPPGQTIFRGSLDLPARASIGGSIRAAQDVKVGEDALVQGDIIAGGNVVVLSRARVEGVIISRGSVAMGRDSLATAIVSMRETTLAQGARVLRRVVSGEAIQALPTVGDPGSPSPPGAAMAAEPTGPGEVTARANPSPPSPVMTVPSSRTPGRREVSSGGAVRAQVRPVPPIPLQSPEAGEILGGTKASRPPTPPPPPPGAPILPMPGIGRRVPPRREPTEPRPPSGPEAPGPSPSGRPVMEFPEIPSRARRRP